ncbi:MAG: UDP-2,3-diacylglucosamine diphosphatase [Cyclobacteriaceae bacterium]
MKTFFKTIVLSDIHLGTKGSKAREVVEFLKYNRCQNLILNGDIIDGWQLSKSGTWKRKHTKFINRILKMIEDDKTSVYYLRGNHDDFLDQILPLRIGNLSIQRDLVYESFGKSYYIVHGDIFDSITTHLKWIAKLGDVGYTLLLWLNQRYNSYRVKRGLSYYSLSQIIKSKVKSAVNYVDNYEKQLAELAKSKKYDGVICGHIHSPAIKKIDGISYMNSGDWVETKSALVEDENGHWDLVYYADTVTDKDEEVEVGNHFIDFYRNEEPDDLPNAV